LEPCQFSTDQQRKLAGFLTVKHSDFCIEEVGRTIKLAWGSATARGDEEMKVPREWGEHSEREGRNSPSLSHAAEPGRGLSRAAVVAAIHKGPPTKLRPAHGGGGTPAECGRAARVALGKRLVHGALFARERPPKATTTTRKRSRRNRKRWKGFHVMACVVTFFPPYARPAAYKFSPT